MNTALHLTIATPERTMVDATDVRAVRAADESGSFGLLPGHADLLTVLPASVVRWRDGTGETRYCAVRGGVLSMTGGQSVAIACRRAQIGTDLSALESDILATRAEEGDAERRARVAQMRLHARAIRQMMRYLVPGTTNPLHLPDAEGGSE